MSVQLSMLPFPSHAEFSHSVLGPVEPTTLLRQLLEDIQETRGRGVPLSFNTYLSNAECDERPHYGNTQEDAYGDRLKHVAVSDLMPLLNSTGVEESWLASSCWSYMAELPESWRVALYWH